MPQPTGNLASHVLFKQARIQGHRTAVMTDVSRASYRDIADLAYSYASHLTQRGIQEEDRVLIAMPDSVGFVGAFFGILSVGAVAVPAARPDEAQYIADKTGCSLALVDVSTGIEKLDRCSVLSVNAKSMAPFGKTISAADYFPTPRAFEDIAYILFSSGSTGPAKGIPHRHIDLLHCAASYADSVLNYQPDDVVLCVPKLPFGYALGCNLVFPLLAGAASILLDSVPTPEAIEKIASQYSPTIFIGQPRNLPRMLEDEALKYYKDLRLAVVAGEKLSPVLARRWEEKYPGVPLLDGYGTTESGAIFLSNTTEKSRFGSQGRPVPGYEVKLLRPDDYSSVADGGIGELWFRGPSACSAYWNDPKATSERIRDGWVCTGDLFSRDADGYYYFINRGDSMLKVGCGEWINPLSIESAIQKVDEVAECAVVGDPDSDGVIQLKSFILLMPGERPTRSIRDTILRTVKSSFPAKPSHHIGQLEFVSDFPRTSTGKLNREALKSHTQMEFSYQC